MQQAVCVVLPIGLSWETIVAVSRRNDPTMWGLPGGKVEPGESPSAAIIREAKEELGLDLSDQMLEVVSSGWDGQYFVITYMATKREYTVDPMVLTPESELTISCKTWTNLCDPSQTPWAEYNAAVANSVRTRRRALPPPKV